MLAKFVGGRYNGLVCDIEDAKQNLEVVGKVEDLSEIRKKGGFCHSAILDNQPIFKDYLSPMLDCGNLRYETQEIYDLSFD